MNKNVIIGLVVVVLAAGGYYYYEYSWKPAQEVAAAADKAAADKAAADKAAEEKVAADKAAEEKAAADAAAAAAATAAMEELLKPENFDLAQVTALIDGSAADDATKATLKAALTAAQADPTALAAVLVQIKAAVAP